MTGPIDDPRSASLDPNGLAAQLFDEDTRARLKKVAEEMQFSPLELIREGTLRYLDSIQKTDGEPLPDSPSE